MSLFPQLLLWPHPKAQEKTLKVHISLCVHRSMDVDAVVSLYGLILSPAPKFSFAISKGDALIDRSRSIAASQFLRKTQADVLLFLDDDIIYEPLDVIKICKLANEKKAIAGASYIVKDQKAPRISIKLFPDQQVTFNEDQEPCKVQALSTGCMAIHRNVLEEMAKTMPLCHPDSLQFYPFFQPEPMNIPGVGMIYASEDWAACLRAQKLGFDCWLDPSVRLGHAGRYIFSLDDLEQ